MQGAANPSPPPPGSDPLIQVRTDELTWREVEDEIVVLDRRNWGYISINGTGALLWPHLVSGTSKRALVDALRGAFPLDEDQARNDVARFLATLVQHDLLADAG